MIITNKKQLAKTGLRKDVLNIIEAGIKGVQVDNIMSAVKYNASKKILKINSSSFKIKGRVFVVGGGKASGAMAEKPELFISVLVLVALPETIVVLGFVIGFLIIRTI